MALRLLDRIETALGHAEELLAMALVVVLLAVVNLQIFARYLFHHPFIWPEEVSRLALVWMTFIGGAALTRIGGDLAVDTFLEMLPHRPKRIALMLRDSAMIVVFAIVAFEGVELARAVNNMPLVATGLPTALLAWPVIIGAGLVVFHCAVRLMVAILRPAAEVPHTPKALT
jgi:TRAP-type C4-dicarboxylate transport system permease small subunit